jgi:hypothetical protein
MATQNPQLLSDLYSMNFNRYSGGIYDPKSRGSVTQDINAQTLEDYERLTGGGGTVAPMSAPTNTLRNVARPTISSSPSYMGMKSVGGGGGGKGTTPGGLPEYDMGKVESLAQRAAAPGIRRLRTTMGEVQQGYYENPNVKRMTLRDALAGYGQGLEDVMGGAMRTGASIYGQEYGLQGQAALQANQIASTESMHAESIAANERMNQYNNEWREYLANLGR